MPTVNETQAKITHFLLKYILRRKNITLKKVKAIMLLGDLEEKMISKEYFDKPLCDIDLAFIADIKRTINNARVYLRHREFTFDGWMMWTSGIRLFSFTTHQDLIGEYANTILHIMVADNELQNISRRHTKNTTMYQKRVFALLAEFMDDSKWDEDIATVSKISIDSAIKAITDAK